jgi:DNA repair protein RadA/Sms
MVEEKFTKPTGNEKYNYVKTNNKPASLSQIEPDKYKRLDTCINEFNRILGGGIIPGSLILLGGEPGIGKSTLALQTALKAKQLKTLYVSGEESLEQLKIRAQRINIDNDACLFLNETSLEAILNHISHEQPQFVIIDSVQTLFSETIDSVPGSVSQIRESAGRLLRMAKEKHIAVLLIGHITKDGTIAGPKVLEHIVDTVMQFEGDNRHSYRILRSNKNRFGSTSEIGIFEMNASGLHEVQNPSELLIPHSAEELSGVSIACTIDGIRPFLIEVQALVSTAAYGTPQRSSTGFDTRRLNMLLAVLEKRVGFHLAAKDIFINLAGGIKIIDPGIDLAIISAILSSNVDMPISRATCFTGEVGLTGEIRPVDRIDQRIAEAEKLGFKHMVIPKGSKLQSAKSYNIKITQASKLDKAFKEVFA